MNRADLEMATIWAFVLDPVAYAAHGYSLQPYMFANPACARALEGMQTLQHRGAQINLANLSMEMGGIEMPNPAEGIPDLRTAVKKIIEFAMRDAVAELQDALTGDADPFESMRLITATANKMAAMVGGVNVKSKKTMLQQLFEDAEANRAGKIIRIPTGIPTLDRFTKGGLKMRNITFLGGPPAAGKTSFVLQMFANAAERGFKTAFLEGEMSEDELLYRMAGQYSRVPYDEIESGHRMEELMNFATYYEKLPMEIHGVYDRTMDNLLGACRRAIHNGAQLIGIDYLQVFSDKGDARNEFSNIKKMSEALRQSALVNNVHYVILSSLNRLEATSGQLTLNSFYGGSQLGHDCWAGLILTKKEEQGPDDRIRDVILDVVKVRGGRTGEIDIRYELETQFMSEYARVQIHPSDPNSRIESKQDEQLVLGGVA